MDAFFAEHLLVIVAVYLAGIPISGYLLGRYCGNDFPFGMPASWPLLLIIGIPYLLTYGLGYWCVTIGNKHSRRD